jgi:uncharacterized protein
MVGIDERVLRYVEEHLRGERVSGLDHSLRVLRWCERLAEGRKVDREVLRLAALLHDVSIPESGRLRHYDVGADMAVELLRELGYPEEKVKAVAHCIKAHSRYGGPDPHTAEAEILYDADFLDYLGAIGILRGILRALVEGEYSGDVSEAPEVLEAILRKYRRPLYTEEGRRIAEGRLRLLESFLKRLREELEQRC